MPFALLIIGALLLVAAVRGTQDKLFGLVKGDFTGQDNYVYWMLSILLIGALGYIPSLTKLSRLFMALVVVVLFLHKQGFFSQFQSQISQALPGGVGLGGTNSSSTGLTDLGGLGNLATLPGINIEQPLAPARPDPNIIFGQEGGTNNVITSFPI